MFVDSFAFALLEIVVGVLSSRVKPNALDEHTFLIRQWRRHCAARPMKSLKRHYQWGCELRWVVVVFLLVRDRKSLDQDSFLNKLVGGRSPRPADSDRLLLIDPPVGGIAGGVDEDATTGGAGCIDNGIADGEGKLDEDPAVVSIASAMKLKLA